MRVLIVSQMYPRHDAPTYAAFIQRQAAELVRAGAEVHVLAPMMYSPPPLWVHERWRGYGQAPLEACNDGVRAAWPRYLSLPGMRFHFIEGHTIGWALKKQIARLRALDFDVIHANRLFPEGLAAMTLKKELKLPMVAMARGMDVNLIPKWGSLYRAALRKVVRGADGILSVSRGLLEELAEIEKPAVPTGVVYNGVDPLEPLSHSGGADRDSQETKRSLRRELGLPEDGLLAAYVGRLEPDKGTPELLRAFGPVARRHDVHLAAIGEVRCGGYFDDVTRAGWQAQAHFLGQRPYGDVKKLMRASDLFVFPSRLEGVPNAVLEAMSAGLPIVATAAGGVPEIVPDDCGAVVAVGDVRAFEHAIVGLIENAERREAYGANARRHVLSKFTWEKNAGGLLTFYKQLTESRSGMQAWRRLAA